MGAQHNPGSRCARCLSRPSMMVERFDSECPAVVMLPLRAALCTETSHDDMSEAHVKTAPLLNSLLHRSEEIVIQVHALSARVADHVVVVSLLCVVVDEVVAKTATIHAAEPLKQFERAVDGRLVHALNTRLDVLDYLLRGQVSMGLVDDINDEAPLRRQPESLLLQSDAATHGICNPLQSCPSSPCLSTTPVLRGQGLSIVQKRTAAPRSPA